MKKLPFIFLIVLITFHSFAQNKTFGVGTTTLNPNAALQIDAPNGNQGVLLPRVTTAQRTAMTLTTADKGLVVFDTDLNLIHTWNGTVWGNGTVSSFSQKIIFPYKDSLAINPAAGEALFHLVNASNQPYADVIKGVMRGTGGAAGSFIVRNAANTKTALYSETNGTGNAGLFIVNNSASGKTALVGTTNSNLGGGLAPVGVYGESTGTGSLGGAFWNTNAANTWPALYARTQGTSSSMMAETSTGFASIYAHQSSTLPNKNAMQSVHDGTGNGLAGLFQNTNATNQYPAIQAETAGIGHGVKVLQNATSLGGGLGVFIQNPASTGLGITVDQQGLANAGYFKINNAANTSEAIYAETNGTGNAITAVGAIQATRFIGSNAGTTGPAGYFINSNTLNNSDGLTVFALGATARGIFSANNSTAETVSFRNDGTGATGFFENTSASNPKYVLTVTTQGTGQAGRFIINNASNSSAAIEATTGGTGSGVLVNHYGSSGDIMVFQSSFTNVARIDKAGKGWFNGGTATGGADLAELFDVEGSKSEYEPGDVLVISESTDRRIEKSNAPNSTKVAGVYATKPGVILTEKEMNESMDSLVPMGVIGVIPTKVCSENGFIRRGDLLVTSSKSGHAMKAVSAKGDGMFPAGVIIGKALENFEAGEVGLIRVLVNVK